MFKNEYPIILGYTYFEVSTGSMTESIKEKVIIVKLDSSYEVNDVVTYKSNNSYITHRIVSIDDNQIITKGDANIINDNPISKERIIGEVVLVLRGFGNFISILTDKVTIILSFIFIIIIFYIIYLKEVSRYEQ